ncbi:MAG: DUF1576 domain-containing protein [Fusobacteriaceae bacterium]
MDKNILDHDRKVKVLWLSLLTLFFIMFFTIIFIDKENIFEGFVKIITSQAVLITDFLVIGGLGGTFLNAALIFIFNFTMMKILGIPIKGVALASFFTVFGFSFFGKNILNILPIYLGGILYTKYEHIDFSDIYITISFTSALAPFISEVAFKVDAGQSSYLSGITLGIIIGFLVTPIAKKMAGFHEGFNLYNLGFTGGIIGAVISAIMKAYKFQITPRRLISEIHDTELKIIAITAFAMLFIVGFYKNNMSFKGLREIHNDSGLKSDFVEKYGYAPTFMNMGLMGFVGLLFVTLLGEKLNGPLLAGVLTLVGFSAYGKHFKNTVPILIGVFLASLGTTKDYFIVCLSGLFGTSMAPIAGVYGVWWGIIAGWLHLSVVQSIGVIHGGLNLYNNGFSAGIVAGFLLPIMNTIKANKENKKINYLKRKKELYNSMTKFKTHLKSEEEKNG